MTLQLMILASKELLLLIAFLLQKLEQFTIIEVFSHFHWKLPFLKKGTNIRRLGLELTSYQLQIGYAIVVAIEMLSIVLLEYYRVIPLQKKVVFRYINGRSVPNFLDH